MRGETGSDNFGCLLILHFVLTLVTASAILALSPLEPSGGLIVLVFFLCIIPTALVWRATPTWFTAPTSHWYSPAEVALSTLPEGPVNGIPLRLQR